MFNWLREWFSARRSQGSRSLEAKPQVTRASAKEGSYEPIPLSQLYVEPDRAEDFDKQACERLIATIARAGVSSVADVHGICVSLEDFFIGNRCRHSIAANAILPPPYDRAESWYELLKTIQATPGVEDVFIQISMIEPDHDGRVGMWPYSDTIWIYSTLGRDAVAALVAPLESDEVRDTSSPDPGWVLKPPFPASGDARAYWVWWD
jgi:hypothetical protein